MGFRLKQGALACLLGGLLGVAAGPGQAQTGGIATNANTNSAIKVFAANDLGMHCSDQDFRVFSILPPFNVVHAQVVQKGAATATGARILTGTTHDVYYALTNSATDPAGTAANRSFNTGNRIAGTTSTVLGVGNKTNFWDLVAGQGNQTFGTLSYRVLYPTLDKVSTSTTNTTKLCTPDLITPGLTFCLSALDAFLPLVANNGLPVPDPNDLGTGTPPFITPSLVFQQPMPGATNAAQRIKRFDDHLDFFPRFAGFPFTFQPTGYRLAARNWFAADGIPILPVDDQRRQNAYPLMRVGVTARSNGQPAAPGASNVVATQDIVLPVASEADCQSCHGSSVDGFSGLASTFSDARYANGTTLSSVVARASNADVPQGGIIPGYPLTFAQQNAAKINVLRLHDAKHGSAYQQWTFTGGGASLQAAPCAGPVSVTNGVPRYAAGSSCLDARGANADGTLPAGARRTVQCSQCHYTPALDLAQAGPVDEPELGAQGRQQQGHISMSNAMHRHHGLLDTQGNSLNAATVTKGDARLLFPDMADPVSATGVRRTQASTTANLNETCYQCHPGKVTQCMRGAMATGGVACQDCHGQMRHVGNDFTRNMTAANRFPNAVDFSKRIPWANEPKCQSCHIGDAMNAGNTAGQTRANFLASAAIGGAANVFQAPDGIRLLQAYTKSALTAANTTTNGSQGALAVIAATASRFAENRDTTPIAGGQKDVLYRVSTGHGGVMCKSCHGATHSEWPNANPNANDNVAAIQSQGHSGTIVECNACHTGTLPNNLNGPHGMHPISQSWANGGHENAAENNPNACRACHGRTGQGTVLSKTAVARTFTNIEDRGTVTFTKGQQIGCTHCHENEL